MDRITGWCISEAANDVSIRRITEKTVFGATDSLNGVCGSLQPDKAFIVNNLGRYRNLAGHRRSAMALFNMFKGQATPMQPIRFGLTLYSTKWWSDRSGH